MLHSYTVISYYEEKVLPDKSYVLIQILMTHILKECFSEVMSLFKSLTEMILYESRTERTLLM